jgi:predicted ATPase
MKGKHMLQKLTNLHVSKLMELRGLNIALTGGPSVGKTTHVLALGAAGFIVLPEMASILIQQAKTFLAKLGLEVPKDPNNVDPKLVRLFYEHGIFHPMVNNPAFQHQLFTRQLVQEEVFASRKIKAAVAFDRTFVDNYPYCKYYGVKVPDEFQNITPTAAERLDLCFVLESFGGFVDNGIRVEKVDSGADFAKVIGPNLGNEYVTRGVRTISVPAMQKDTLEESVKARQTFMWEHIIEYAEMKVKELSKAA